jgi:hypothetical protein
MLRGGRRVAGRARDRGRRACARCSRWRRDGATDRPDPALRLPDLRDRHLPFGPQLPQHPRPDHGHRHHRGGHDLVILIGGIDLAVGSVMALSMMVLGYLHVEAGLPMTSPSRWRSGGRGDQRGGDRGLLITQFMVPAFIATLAMMSIARGPCQHDHQRLSRSSAFRALVQHGGDHPLRRFHHDDRGRDAGRCSSLAFLYQRYRYGGARSTPSAATPRSPGLPASTSSGRRCWSTPSAACLRGSRASCWPRGSTRCSRRSGWPTSSTPSRRSSSAAPPVGRHGRRRRHHHRRAHHRRAAQRAQPARRLALPAAVVIGLVIVLAVAAETIKHRSR